MTLRALVCIGMLSCAATKTGDAPKTASTTASASPAISYADAVKWICMPGAAFDACKTDLTATELLPDGTRKAEPHVAARDPKVDCFYVYPTVDMELVPGNHEDFEDTHVQRNTTLSQVGQFTEACAVWAPLYRQVTFGTYLRSKERIERGLAIAFADIEAAFREYLARAPSDHKIVLVGHSQGGQMVIRLVKKFFDSDPAMRSRLLLAMPIGADVDTAVGKTTGGTFDNVPVCSQPNEVGCVVAYRSFAEGPVETTGTWLPAAGRASACVNPASIDGGDGRFSHAYFPNNGLIRRLVHAFDGVESPYIDLPDLYAGRCVTQPNGFAYLEVREAARGGDSRAGAINLHQKMGFAKLGLHLLDMQFAQGDLIAMIARRSGEVAPQQNPR